MSKQFIAYHVDDWREDGAPIAAGTDEEAVRADAIRRTLTMGLTTGNIAMQRRDDLSNEDFSATCKAIDEYFAEKFPGLTR